MQALPHPILKEEWMLRNLRQMIALSLLAVLAMTSAPRAQEDQKPPPQPKIYIEELRYDLGEVYEQDKYSHKFKVENKGNADLKIEKVKPG